MLCRIIIVVFIVFFPSLVVAAVSNSGLPLPRFVSLKSDEVNVRVGAGTQYPTLWVYRRAGMPVEVIDEFNAWRKIRDSENAIGWVYKNMLEGKRNALIRGKKPQIVRAEPNNKAKPLLKIEPSVIVRLVQCSKSWCLLQTGKYKGWIEKKLLWGVYPDELIE